MKPDPLRERLGGIEAAPFRGDNLAIFLASEFEPGIEDDELDESGTWKQGAIDAANAVLDAIHAHYADALLDAHQRGRREGMEEAAEICNERGTQEQDGFGLGREAQNYYRARDAIRAKAQEAEQ